MNGSENMDIFVARQPILTRDEELFGYELLYRNSQQNSFTEMDGDAATTDLLLNSFLGIGNENLSRGKILFINFTKNLLLKRIPSLLSPDKIVIEILEDVQADPDIIAAVEDFKAQGYTIALDDYVPTETNKNLLPYADILKIDFLHTSKEDRTLIRKIAKLYNLQLLAEKIETREDFEIARGEGFKYFQGYFFSKPVIISSTDIPFYSHGYARILNELSSIEPNIDKISSLIEADLSLSYKLLKIVNTTGYYTKVKITSIKQAIVHLGLNELIRWITIITLKVQQEKTSKAEELLVRSLIRGKFAEQFGEILLGAPRKAECFMLGMFSLLDAILQRPMDIILKTLPLSDEVKNALLKQESELTIMIDLIEGVEQANWELLNSYNFAPSEVAACYESAIQWTNGIADSLQE